MKKNLKPWKDEFNPFLISPLTAQLKTTGETISIFRVIDTIDGPVVLFTDDRHKTQVARVGDVEVTDMARYRQLAYFCVLSDLTWKKFLVEHGEVWAAGEKLIDEGE